MYLFVATVRIAIELIWLFIFSAHNPKGLDAEILKLFEKVSGIFRSQSFARLRDQSVPVTQEDDVAHC
jgi:hypothetical protein